MKKTFLLVSAFAIALATACVLPRSVGLGQTAAPLGGGNAEASASLGAQFTQFTDNGAGGGGNPSFFTLPVTEANFQYGLSDSAGFNLHMSAAGLQPGVKLTLVNGPVKFALLPEIGAGLLFGTVPGTGTSSSSSSAEFEFMVGMKILVSLEGGFYAGLGYDFSFISANTGVFGGTGTPTNQSLISHALTVGAGYEFRAGMLRIRPELGFLWSPGYTVSQNGASATADGHLIFYPNVTFSLAGLVKAPAPATEPLSPPPMPPPSAPTP